MCFESKSVFHGDLPGEFWKDRVPFMMFRVLDGAVSPSRGAFPTYHTTPHAVSAVELRSAREDVTARLRIAAPR